MYTEEEAKELICITLYASLTAAIVGKELETDAPDKLALLSMCHASDCMMWVEDEHTVCKDCGADIAISGRYCDKRGEGILHLQTKGPASGHCGLTRQP